MRFNLKGLFERDELSDIDEFFEEANEVFLGIGPDQELNEIAKKLMGSSTNELIACERTVQSDPTASLRSLQKSVDELVKAYLIVENGLDRKGLTDIENEPLMWFVYFLKRMKRLLMMIDPSVDDRAIHDTERMIRKSGAPGIIGSEKERTATVMTYDDLMDELSAVDRMVDDLRESLMELDETDQEKSVGNQLYILFDRAEEMFAIYNVSRLIFDNELHMRDEDQPTEDWTEMGIIRAVPELSRRIRRLQESVSKIVD